MKKKLALMLALIMAMSLALAGCGGSSEKDIAGVYKLVEMENNGEDITDQIKTMAEYDIVFAYLVLEEKGEGYIAMMMEDKQDLEWDKDVITIDGEDAEYTFKGDKITLEEEGTKMVFEKLSKKEMSTFEEAEENNFELDMDKLMEAYSAMEEE